MTLRDTHVPVVREPAAATQVTLGTRHGTRLTQQPPPTMTQRQDIPPEQYAEISPTTDNHGRLLLVVQERHRDGYQVHALSSREPLEAYNDILDKHQMEDGTISWGAMTEEEQDTVLAERDVDIAAADVLTYELNTDE